ncbi:hypothetical protein Vretimale_4475 [Volvox reticuliferus]|uniref:Uncharacterized protein n=1 Tax=Volvox reticuliferus TaxID=1737510 RepID=A0A8J4G1E9_9CHLO|nr:hypothetical protein Vretimale_4475 [Volvox reticuliferus]
MAQADRAVVYLHLKDLYKDDPGTYVKLLATLIKVADSEVTTIWTASMTLSDMPVMEKRFLEDVLLGPAAAGPALGSPAGGPGPSAVAAGPALGSPAAAGPGPSAAAAGPALGSPATGPGPGKYGLFLYGAPSVRALHFGQKSLVI